MNCNNQNHWENIIIYGECNGSCGLTKEFIETERKIKAIDDKVMADVEIEIANEELSEKDELRNRYGI